MKRSRIVFIFTLALTLTGASSCVKDSINGDDPDRGNGGDKDRKFLALTVNLTSDKAVTRYNTEFFEPQAHEMMVEGARLVIYANDKVHFVKDFADVSNVNSGDPTQLADKFTGTGIISTNPYVFQTEAIDLEAEGFDFSPGSFKMALLLNPGSELTDITQPGRPLADLTETARNVTYPQLTNLTGTSGNRFVMSNLTGLAHLTSQAHFYKTKEAAENSPVALLVSRAVALVCFSIRENIEMRAAADLPEEMYYQFYNPWFPTWEGNDAYFSLTADIQTVQWAMNVVNKKYYPLRKPTYTYYGSTEPGSMESFMELWSNGEIYAEDPNFTGYSSISGGTDQMREQNFVYLADGSTINMKPTLMDADEGYPLLDPSEQGERYAYVPENTLDRMEQTFRDDRLYNDVATTVVVGLNLKLREENYESRAVPPPLDDHLFQTNVIFKGDDAYSRFFPGTQKEVNTYLAGVYRLMESGGTGLVTEVDRTDNTTAVESLRKLDTFVPVVEYLKDTYGWNGEESTLDWDNWESFRLQNFAFYHQGRMYYNVPIRHFEGSHMGITYGVVRNNIYHIITPSRLRDLGSVKPDVSAPVLDVLGIYVVPWEIIDINYNFGSLPEQ